jgi:hypothetical protein
VSSGVLGSHNIPNLDDSSLLDLEVVAAEEMADRLVSGLEKEQKTSQSTNASGGSSSDVYEVHQR